MDIKSLKDKILQLAIQGKLVPQNENDEPASVLLKKIKEEREQLIKDKVIKKEKPLPEINEEEKQFELPKSWEWIKIGNISQKIHYGYTASAEENNTGIKLLRITDIQDNKVNWNTVPFCNIEKSKLDSCKLSNNDLLIARTGGTIGKSFIVTNIECEAVFASYLIRIKPLSNISPKYIKIFLESPFYWEQLQQKSQGTGQPNVNAVSLSNLVIPLPPLEEQKRIVSKADELFELIDELDKNKQDLLDSISNSRNKVLQLAIQGKLVEQCENDEPASVLLEKIKQEKEQLIKDKVIKKEKPLPEINEEEKQFELPKGWEWVRLFDIYRFIDYRGKTPNKIENGIPLVTAKNVKKGYIDYTIQEFISKEEFEDRKSRGVSKKGDILFTTEAPMGNVALANLIDFSAGQRLITFQQYTNDDFLINKLFMYFIMSKYFQKQLMDNKTGTTVYGIKADKLKRLIIPVPPLEEQKRIVAKVDLIMDYLDKLQEEMESQEIILDDIL